MKYKDYKDRLVKFISNLPTSLQPLNMDRTLNVSFGSCFRLPTYTEEPYFVNRYGPFKPEEKVEDIKGEVDKIKINLIEKLKINTTSHSGLNRIIFAKALDATSELLGIVGKKFRPMQITDAAQVLSRNTSSGFPDYVAKSSIVNETVERAANLLYQRDDSFLNLPITLSWRTQMRKTGIKFRPIWLVPFIIILFEGIFFLPIIDYIQAVRNTSYCIGNVFTDLSVRYTNLQKNKYIYSLDYASYDSSISVFFINLFFSKIKEHLAINSQHNWLFEKIREYSLNAIIITGYDRNVEIFRKKNGLLSGSLITNFLGSFVNLFIISYFLIDHNIDPIKSNINVMSDDCLFSTNEYFSLEYISRYFKEKFGIEVSIEKSEIYGQGVPVYFLGAYIDSDRRYINIDLIRKQLRITTSFNKELSEYERVFSKLCSSLFKYTDGWYYFKQEIPHLQQHFGVSKIPEFYVDLSTPSAGPNKETGKLVSVSDNMFNGWRRQ